MASRPNWQAALAAWLLATFVVGGGYAAFQFLGGRPISWRRVAIAAGLASIYALYLAVRFRERPPGAGDGGRGPG